MKKEYLTEDPEWVTFDPSVNIGLYIEKAGYFDERPEIHTSVTQSAMLLALPVLIYFSMWFLLLLPFLFVGWGKLWVHLPIRTGIQDCESAAWGINYHNNMIWIYIGGAGNFEGGKKWKTITMPWDYAWVRTSVLLSDGNEWWHETKHNRKKYGEDATVVGSSEWIENNKWKSTHEYVDSYDQTVVLATISVKEREWRQRWLSWTRLFAKISKDIDIEFDQEVGKSKGSWKGGCLGCGYKMRTGESPIECLKRMERERKF